MLKVIGTVFTSFKGTDGSDVSGTTLYVTEPIAPDKGKGERADKLFFLTSPFALCCKCENTVKNARPLYDV